MMSAPVLSRKLVLETRQDVADGMGGFSVSWSALGSVWAQVEARAGREAKIGARDVSSVAYRIVLRTSAPGSASRPRPDQRFREGSRIFNIHAVTEADTDGRFLACWTEEGRG